MVPGGVWGRELVVLIGDDEPPQSSALGVTRGCYSIVSVPVADV